MNKNDSLADSRNYGIDLLRIISMSFIVIIHTVGHGGILKTCVPNSIKYNIVLGIEVFAFCAVDIFALISGFVSYTGKKKKYNISSYIKLWLEVVFYGVIITAVLNLTGQKQFAKSDYYSAILPVSNFKYWYFTAFTGLFVLKPFIDSAIFNIEEKTLKKVLILGQMKIKRLTFV